MQDDPLYPFPILERPWESVSMEFITQLQFIQGYSGIIFVVKHFSKYAIFIPTKVPCATEEVAKLFFKNVVNYWGLLFIIMSDGDTWLTGRFWTELFKLI
jgi:hypothetical protein